MGSGDHSSDNGVDATRRYKKRLVLENHDQCGNITQACEDSNVPRSTFYNWRRDDPEFAKAFIESERRYSDVLIGELHKRATIGSEIVAPDGTTRHFPASDSCLFFALKRLRPEFRDNYINPTGTGPVQVNILLAPTATANLAITGSRVPDGDAE